MQWSKIGSRTGGVSTEEVADSRDSLLVVISCTTGWC